MSKNLLKKGLVSGILILFFCLNLQTTGIIVEQSTRTLFSSGNTLYVGGSGGGNYTTIQSAVENASNGDTVFVYDEGSPYYENITIDKSINLIGEDKNTTVIDYNNSNSERIIFIVSDNVSISGFTIQNSMGNGIEIEYYFGNCTISDNIIANNFFDGICMHRSNNNIIKDNNFYDNHAMFLSLCNNNNITGNTINHSFYYQFPRSGIIIVNSKWNNISGNMIKDNGDGILLLLSEYNFIFNNIITSNEGYGIEIRDSSDNCIFGNNISYNCDPGIYIKESANNNFFYHNNFVYNSGNAVDEGNNIWDDGDSGNYWNDYKEKYPFAMKNPFKPWIWNTPYEIEGGSNMDNCPLVKPWPKSKPKDIPNNRAISNPLILSFLEHFLFLNLLLNLKEVGR
jgi:parallel beta-helix repeat protein